MYEVQWAKLLSIGALAIIDDVANTHKKNRILNKNTKIVKTKLDSSNWKVTSSTY